MIRDLELDINPTSVATLVKAYNVYLNIELTAERAHEITKNTIVGESLFPKWLDGATTITSSPADWTYVGFFPWGYWVNDQDTKTIH